MLTSYCAGWIVYYFPQVKYVLLKAVLVYGVTFFIILPFCCRNLPYSKYFVAADDINRRVFDNNQRRVQAAEDYLSKLEPRDHKLQWPPRPGNLRLAIGVVSVERQKKKPANVGTQYLTQVMAKLHKTIARHGVQDTTFTFICDVEKNGVQHTEANRLATYFHVRRFPLDLTRHEKMSREREKENYAFCLESAAMLKADYVLLLQDDALPHDNFYDVLDYLFKSRLERLISRGRGVRAADDWLWLKLNFPDVLADFHRSPYFVYEWIALSLTAAGITSLFYHIYASPDSPSNKSRKHWVVLYSIFVLSFGYFFLASWVIGRPYFLRLYGLSKYFTKLTPGTSCCLPAVLFPRGQIEGLVNYLKVVKCHALFPLDFALDAYREKTQLKQYLAVPNLFSHIGYFSALHQGVNTRDAYAYLD